MLIIAYILILGACFGSFFNVIIDRVPKKQSIVLPASHCTACGAALPIYLNIPILSYLVLRGKCKYCGVKIHIHHLFVEILTPFIFIALYWKFGTNILLFAKYVVMFFFLIPIFFIDFYERIIPDKLSIPMAMTGLIFALLPASDIHIINALVSSAGILIVMLLIAWLFQKVRHKEGMGGGDIKLLAALAAYMGAVSIAFVLLFASILAIIVALASSRSRKFGIPYGPFLVTAALLMLLVGDYFLNWYISIL